MTRDDLKPWLRWMPEWLMIPVTTIILCELYFIFAFRGLLFGLKKGHAEVQTGMQIVRAIIQEEKSDERPS